MDMNFVGPMIYSPNYAHTEDAGLDMVAAEAFCIPPGTPTMISLGVAVNIPDGHFGLLTHRSSLPLRSDCIISTGIIDSNYTGTVKAIVINLSDEVAYIYKGDRIAQLVVMPYTSVNPVQVESLSKTDRGDGGFGSSGR